MVHGTVSMGCMGTLLVLLSLGCMGDHWGNKLFPPEVLPALLWWVTYTLVDCTGLYSDELHSGELHSVELHSGELHWPITGTW